MSSPEKSKPPRPLHELLGRPAPVAPPANAPATASGDGAAGNGASHVAPPDESGGTGPRRLALVDGSNVAHAGEGTRARLANILAVRDKLIEDGFDPVIVADAALRHQIDDAAGYERLVETGTVKQAPAGTDADYFILSFAKELDGSIVSNDQFRDRSRQFAEVRNRIIRYMVVAGEVVFEKRTSRRRS
jgi:hypothetical protein